MNTIIIVLGILLVIYFLYHMIYTYSEIKYVKSDIDDKVYLISMKRFFNKLVKGSSMTNKTILTALINAQHR